MIFDTNIFIFILYINQGMHAQLLHGRFRGKTVLLFALYIGVRAQLIHI